MSVQPAASKFAALAAVIAFGLSGSTASAQEATATPGPSTRELNAQCVAEARAKGLKGPSMRSAVLDCLEKARPELAGGIECRRQGVAQKLSGSALKDFVRQCRRSKSSKGASTTQSPAQ